MAVSENTGKEAQMRRPSKHGTVQPKPLEPLRLLEPARELIAPASAEKLSGRESSHEPDVPFRQDSAWF
jgi:hypothetical protein